MERLWLTAWALAALLFPAVGQSQTTKALPADVRHFLEQRELCEHFANEDAYDEARRRYLARQVGRYCTSTDRRLEQLKKKYGKDPAVLHELRKPDAHAG